MRLRWWRLWLVAAAAASALGCGGEAPPETSAGRLLVDERNGERLAGR
jgi:hypothetical protein